MVDLTLESSRLCGEREHRSKGVSERPPAGEGGDATGAHVVLQDKHRSCDEKNVRAHEFGSAQFTAMKQTSCSPKNQEVNFHLSVIIRQMDREVDLCEHRRTPEVRVFLT